MSRRQSPHQVRKLQVGLQFVSRLELLRNRSLLNQTARVSKTIIWCIIEPHASIIAASLPSYGTLFRGKGAESWIRSMRSAFSLGSNHSQHEQPPKGFETATIGSGGGNNSKGTSFTGTGSDLDLSDVSGYGQTMAQTDVEQGLRPPVMKKNHVQVLRTPRTEKQPQMSEATVA